MQLQLDGSFAPIYRDATVLVGQKTLVGENYIEITRGLPKYGRVPDGGTLGLSQDLESVPLDKILNSLTPAVRTQVQTDVRSLGAGLELAKARTSTRIGAWRRSSPPSTTAASSCGRWTTSGRR